jgi:hypothetical protein
VVVIVHVYLSKNQKQPKEEPNGKWQMANGKWQMAFEV